MKHANEMSERYWAHISALSVTLILLCFTAQAEVQAVESQKPIRFYIHAHQDDWQLFMADEVFAHLAQDRATVFVYTTAGDRGDDQKYWQARESAAIASQMLMADAVLAKASTLSCGEASLRRHPVRRCAYGKTVAYFMRLPDGGASGNQGGKGFPRYGNQSLQTLREQSCAAPPCSLTAVDDSTTFATWEEFILTLGELIRHESTLAEASEIWLNAPDSDSMRNPGDHSDHLQTGMASRAAGQQLSGFPQFRGRLRFAWYADYDIQNRPANVSAAGYLAKAGVFLAYDQKIWETMQFSPLRNAYDFYTRLLQRTYFRVEDAPLPQERTGFPLTQE